MTIKKLLRPSRDPDSQSTDHLMSLMYEELRRLAGYYMRRERREHTLQPTALVNEAYLRLVGAKVPWQDRTHFLKVAARTMRRLLVDHARSHHRAKRDHANQKISLDEANDSTAVEARNISTRLELDLIALDQALTQFATFDPRKVEIVDLHFFVGLGNEEVAEVLGLSRATVQRELRLAKAWLKRQLK